MIDNTEKKRVVILGAGAAGISAALELKRACADVQGLHVTLVDRLDYHCPLPLTWQVVSGSVEPRHIAFPLRAVLSSDGSGEPIEFRRSTVRGLDVERRVVDTDDGVLKWDYLVVALGSTTNFFGMTDVQENSLTLRSLGDAVSIHNRIVGNYEQALGESDEQRQRELLTFVVVGGGPTGIELVAAIQDFVGNALARKASPLATRLRVLLVEAQDSLLSGMNPRMSELALRRLRSRGIHVLLSTRIARVTAYGIENADGQTISAGTVIWVAGVKPAPVVGLLPFEIARDGRVLVNQQLQIPSAPEIYAIGDCAYLLQRDGARPYPPTQQVAERQGPACARNIIRAIQGHDQLAFCYTFKGQVIYMGRNMSVAQIGGRVFDGLLAALLRRVFYLWVFVSSLGLRMEPRRKLAAIRAWTPAYFYRRNTSRLPEEW